MPEESTVKNWREHQSGFCRRAWPSDPEQIHHSMPLAAQGVGKSSESLRAKTPLIQFCEAHNISHHDRELVEMNGTFLAENIHANQL